MRCPIGAITMLLTLISRSCECPRILCPLSLSQFLRGRIGSQCLDTNWAAPWQNRIYILEKQVNQPEGHPGGDGESAPLLDSSLDTDTVFRRALDAELEKACGFYQLKEMELYREVADLVKDKEAYIENTEGINM